MSEQPRVAITGNTRLLIDGKRLAIDDREMHPRTAVGIDHDTGQIAACWWSTAGRASAAATRWSSSRKLMARFGAEDALNLDGGGSSTIMGLTPEGEMAVLNSPSDGAPRSIPNGLQVLYTAPEATATP